MQYGVKVECCLGIMTPQNFNQSRIGCHPIVPTLRNFHFIFFLLIILSQVYSAKALKKRKSGKSQKKCKNF